MDNETDTLDTQTGRPRPADWALRTLVAAAPATIVAALFGRWVRGATNPTALSVLDEPRSGTSYPGSGWVALGLLLVVALAVPLGVLALWSLRRAKPGRRRLIGPSEACAAYLSVTVVCAVAVWKLGERAGLPLIVTVTALAAGTVAWALVALRAEARPPFHRPDRAWRAWRVTALSAVAVLAAGALTWVGGRWYAEGRHVEASTTDRAAPEDRDPPTRPGRRVWAGPAADEPIHLSGRYAVLTLPGGLGVLDAATGRERWSYTRDDLLPDTPASVVGVDGERMAAVFDTVIERRVLGFDLRTGDVLWDRRLDGRLVPSGARRTAVLSGGFVVDGAGDQVVGHDLGTGEQRWTAAVGCDGLVLDARTVGDATAILEDCGQVAQLTVLGDGDGRERWQARLPVPAGDQLNSVTPEDWLLVGTDSLAVRLDYLGSPDEIAVFDRSGARLWSRQVEGQRAFTFAPTRSGDVLVLATAGDTPALRAVHAPTGAPLWTENGAVFDVAAVPDRLYVAAPDGGSARVSVRDPVTGLSRGQARLPEEECAVLCEGGMDVVVGPVVLLDLLDAGTLALADGDWFVESGK